MIRRKEEDCGLWKWQAQRLNICICILQNAGACFCSCMKKGSMNILFNWEAGGIMNRWKGLWKWRGQRLNILHNSERNTRHHLNLSSITKNTIIHNTIIKNMDAVVNNHQYCVQHQPHNLNKPEFSQDFYVVHQTGLYPWIQFCLISALFMNVSKLLLWSGQFLKQLNLLYGQTLGNGVSKSALILVPTSFQQRV